MAQIIKNNNIISASINSSGIQYDRLRIKKRDKKLFKGLSKLEVEYNNEFFKIDIRDLFIDYGEIDNTKLSEWSNNQHAKVQIDISDIKKGEIKIVNIIKT